jgi:hypothetical protein
VAIARAPLSSESRAQRPVGLGGESIRPSLQTDSPRTAPERRPSQEVEQRLRRELDARQQAHGGPASGQSEVWRSVAAVQARLGEKLAAPVAAQESRTSLQLTLENERLKAAKQSYITALEPKALEGDDVIGVIIAVNGKIASGDVYPSNGLFRKMWPKLVRAAAAEALAGRQEGAASAPVAAEAEKFLAEPQGGTVSERALADIARHETRSSPNVLRVEARTAKGAWIHRNFLSAK